MGWALAWTLAAALGLVLALAALPVRLRLVAASEPAPRLRLLVSLLGGLVPPIPVIDSARSADAPARHRQPPRGARRTRKRRRGRRAPGLRDVAALARSLRHRVRLRRLVLDADFGLADPAETGIAFGLLTAALHGVPGAMEAVALRPDFSGPRLAGRVDAEIGLVPLRLLPPLLRFAVTTAAAGRRG